MLSMCSVPCSACLHLQMNTKQSTTDVNFSIAGRWFYGNPFNCSLKMKCSNIIKIYCLDTKNVSICVEMAGAVLPLSLETDKQLNSVLF